MKSFKGWYFCQKKETECGYFSVVLVAVIVICPFFNLHVVDYKD